MLTRRVIPCLDVQGGRVVKGVRFQSLRDAGSPAERAAAYEQNGADEIVLLDVAATAESRAAAASTVRAVRGVLAIPLTVGGGIRSARDARALLDAGADKVALNTAALRVPGLVAELASRFGSQCVTVSIDASREGARWLVSARAGTERTGLQAAEWARMAVDMGAGEVLLTSIDRDGTQSGYDIGLIHDVATAVPVPVVASGGARTGSDLVAAIEAGADAVLVASILHDQQTTVRELKQTLGVNGVQVRV